MLDRLAALEVADAQLMAARARALVDYDELCRARPATDRAVEFIALDIASACSIAQVTATIRLEQARRLVRDLPQTWTGLHTGLLHVGQALAVLTETTGLTRAVTTQVDALAADRIIGMTSGDSRRTIKRLIVKLDATASDTRRKQQALARRIWHSPRPDGRAFIGAEQSAEAAGAFMAALDVLISQTFTKTDPRTLDQQRADLFSHLPHFALSHLPGGDQRSLGQLLGLRPLDPAGTTIARRRRPLVQAIILVPVETALGLTDNPAELVNYGPITAGHSTELLAAAELRKACTELRTGRIVAVEDATTPAGPSLEATLLTMVDRPGTLEHRDEPQHDPSAGLARFVHLRDPRCTGPGCATPAQHCDLDHLIAYPTGRTTANNLGPVSRRCHNAKTHGGWILQPHPDGSVTWTSPLGRTTTRPSRTQAADLSNLRPPQRIPVEERPAATADDPPPF